MFFLIPYHVDVPMRRLPWMNWVLIVVTICIYPFCISGDHFTNLGEHLMLGGKSWLGVVGHMFVHADIFHLLGNMLFLWVFGNAVCAKVGNLAYPLLYFGLGLVSGVLAYLFDPRPLAGASGAINGIVGVFVVWYLLNEITCWWGYLYFGGWGAGTVGVSSYWMVLLWLIFDIWGLFLGAQHVSYLAHLFGLAGGVLSGILFLTVGLVKMERGERSLLHVLAGEREDKPRKRKRRRRFVD